MKKLLLSAFIGAIGGFSAYADSSTMTEFGYCDDPYIWIAEGISYGYDGNIGLAIRIPANAVQNYRGGKIIGMKIAAADQANEQEVRAFLRKGSLTSENLTSTTDNISWTPLNSTMGDYSNILFDSEWTIPTDLTEDLYLGLYTTVTANQRVVGTSSYSASAKTNTVYIADTNDLTELEPSNWDDITTIPTIYSSNICLKCIIELPSENYQNVMVINDAYMPNFAAVGKYTTGYFYFKNDGPTPITDFEITTTLGEESTAQTITIEGDPMPVGYNATTPLGVPINALGTGKHTVSITKVNGQPNDASAESSKFEFDLVGIPTEIASQHVRRPLYEYFCSETDHNSGRYQDQLIVPSIDAFKGHVTYLPQHSNDKFGQNPIDTPVYIGGEPTTITLTDGDRWAIKLYNGINSVGIPAATIDRTIQMQKVVLAGKVMAQTPMGSGTPTPLAFTYFMNEALTTPTFASVEIENDYNVENNTVNIKVSGTIADLLPEGEKAKLSVFIIEETVESDSQELPDMENIDELYPGRIFTHARVVRQTITNFYGEELEPGMDFVKTYNVEIENPRWNTDHMKVIAVIQRPETNDFLKMDVINTAEEPMTDNYVESGLETIETVRTPDNTLYDLQGRRLSAPVRGINIINGKKILVK